VGGDGAVGGRGVVSPRSGKPAPRPRGRRGAPPPTHGSLRVIAGELRGRRLDAPAGEGTRPTADRVRQATFNALESLGALEGARVFDAFAGSGALGIEALSRGASEATFVDRGASARSVVEANLRSTNLADRARILAGDGTSMAAHGGPWDLVLLDPPYSFEGWPDLLAAVAANLAEQGVVVIESDREVALPPPLVGIRVRQYGSTVVTFASLSGVPS
jgi:16S rRNA (guanine966-N2)-methyltransferase